MDDKTFTKSLQPSTTFERVIPSPSISTAQLTSPSIHQPTSSHIKPIEPATIINQSQTMERKPQFDIKATLMSPPEPTPHETFGRSPTMTSKSHARPLLPKEIFPMSPPVSPDCRPGNPEDPITRNVTDPILFPSNDLQISQPPLFNDNDTIEAQKVVDGHVAARESSMFREASPPRHSEYELALEFKTQVAKSFNADRQLWLRRERAYLMEDKALQSGHRRYTNIAPATGRSVRAPHPKPAKSAGITKPRAAPRPPKLPSANFREGTPDTKKVAREDRDFNALPDYSPPVSSLPNKPNSLKVDWKGAPVSLADDPFVNLVHPDEVSLAANLRLDCATYLTSKRRIFIRRIEAYRIGKDFRKTDAQQACKIDVNKASKLWQAFEKVGWLNEKWILQYV